MKIPLRVLYIDHTAALGGGEVALLNLVRYLDPGVVEPVVLLLADGPLAERLRPGTETHVLALPPSVANARKDGLGWRSIFKLNDVWMALYHVVKVARFARTLKADVIHTNSLKADILGGLAGRLAGIPVIWHVRDRIDPDYLPRPVVHLFRFLSRMIPNFLIANSAATLATLRAPQSKSTTVPSLPRQTGSDVAVVHDGCEVYPIESSSEPGGVHPLIGLVGRISPWKGQDIFLRAAAQLLVRYPEARFQIIGAALFAEHEYEAHLHTLCRELDLEHAVEFVGFVDDVPRRIAQLDVLVHASTTGEPFGQVIIEGMAAGKPVVATDGGGVPEIVDHGTTGLLVPMGDADRMAEALAYLLEHPEEASRMGQLGRERVLQQFTIERTARRMEETYRQFLAIPG